MASKSSLLFILLLGCFSSITNGTSNNWEDTFKLRAAKTSPDLQTEALQGLLERVIGVGAPSFDLRVDVSLKELFGKKDGFRIQSNSSQIVITGTAGYAVANGLNYYIRKFLHGQFTWSGKRIPLPDQLPLPTGTIDITLQDQIRYYENVCTVSYSFVWWQWPQWEREIDWMALNAINFPLAFKGQEFVASEVFKSLGCTEGDMESYFSGPAFLAWNRMGNLRGFGGPLPPSWRFHQQLLQKMILRRMREFGMTPVLPGFNGFLPRAFETLFPDVTFIRASRWNGFPDEYASPTYLSPSEPFFSNVSSLFVKTYTSVYGSDHFYNVDLFNELNPDTGDNAALSKIAYNVYDSLRASDPDAVWVMQAWLFVNNPGFWVYDRVRSFVTAPPKGKLLLLDLFSEQKPQFSRLDNYFGQPFVWCMLHNYGGVKGMFGNFDWINGKPQQTRAAVPNMVGFGLTPEGTGQNEVVYEFMVENSYRDKAEDLDTWFENYVLGRYGSTSSHLINAWKHLRESVYDVKNTGMANHGHYILTDRPTILRTPNIWYNQSFVIEAADEFIRASWLHGSICFEKLFHADFVDVVRQALQTQIASEYYRVIFFFMTSNSDMFKSHSKRLLHNIDLLDEVLGTDEHFLLGAWIADARRSAGNNETLKDLFEFNARNQITRWGPNGEIQDYAAKMWSGLMKDYYGERWRVFIQMLTDSLESKTAPNESDIRQAIIQLVEVPFTQSKKKYPKYAKGNVCELRQKIFKALHPNY